MHSEGGSLAAFSARSKSALGHASHRIHYCIAKLKQFLFLLANERIQLFFAMIKSEQNRRGRLVVFQVRFPRTTCSLLFTCRIFRLGLPGVKFARRMPLSHSRLCRRPVLFLLFL